jgi:DNA-binding response OmpR family regulator
MRVFMAESPDLAVLDINLPGGSGFAICEAIRTLLRRAGIAAGGAMAAGELALDLEAHSLRIAGAEPLRLTKLETRLLQILIANAAAPQADPAEPRYLQTEPGAGYRLTV